MSNVKVQDLTYSEKVLLASVASASIFLTGIIVICITRKSCWVHKCIWKDDKKKSPKMDDIICIRYPPDIYPASVGIYRENMLRSPEDELARLFSSPVKRDSTYSSMSETSSGYDLKSSSSALSSPMTATIVSTPESPELANSTTPPAPPASTTPGTPPGSNASTQVANSARNSNVSEDHLMSMIHSNNRQPFFTFALKYEQENGLVHIDFIESRNMPFREYLNQPSDVFFSVEVSPRKANGSKKQEMMRYRFVTKTIKKAAETCDFSETFLAQLSQATLKDYNIRFTAFDQDRYGNPTELGSTTMTFDDFRDFTQHKLILSCSLREPVIKRGEIMVGLCYLPTAERMSVTINKVTNLNPYFTHGTISKNSICFVRVLQMRADTGKVLRRKKTTFQKLTGSNADQPMFNETLVFDMPPSELMQTVLLVLVCYMDKASAAVLKQAEKMEEGTVIGNPVYRASGGGQEDDGLFHFEENLNPKNKGGRTSSEDNNADSQQRASTTTELHHKPSRTKDSVVGKVAFGFSVKNQIARYHWEKMLRNPRNVSAEWHSLK